MHSAVLLTLLALDTSAAFNAGAPSSYEAWINEFKPCGQSCFETMYSTVVGDSCGPNAMTSTAVSKVQCICRAIAISVQTSTWDNVAESTAECYAGKCPNFDLYQVRTKISDLVSFCEQYPGKLFHLVAVLR